jgi:hypothetical protein
MNGAVKTNPNKPITVKPCVFNGMYTKTAKQTHCKYLLRSQQLTGIIRPKSAVFE